MSLPWRAAPDDVLASRRLANEGIGAGQAGDWAAAETFFQKAVTVCPDDVRAHEHYAESLWRRGEQQAAMAELEEAISLSNGDSKQMVRLGEMHLAQGQMELAKQRAEEAIALQPQLAPAWALRGDALQAMGESRLALASYHRALSYQPLFPQVQVRIAEVYLAQGRPQRALSTLDALAAQLPDGQASSQLWFTRGLALKRMERYNDAIESLLAARVRSAESVDLLYELGDAMLLAGDIAGARSVLKDAQTFDAQHPASHQLAAQFSQHAAVRQTLR